MPPPITPRTQSTACASRTATPLDRRCFLRTVCLFGVGSAFYPAMAASSMSISRTRSAASIGVPDGFASPYAWVEVRPGAFATSHLASGGNCLTVAGENACLLVDTKFPAFIKQIVRDAESLTGSAPTHVLNTHHHADHTGGNLEFAEGRVSVIAHANGLPRVAAQFERNMQGVTSGRRMAGRVDEPFRAPLLKDVASYLDRSSTPLDPGSWVADTPVTASKTGIDLGGAWAEIHHFGRPSHTDNDLVLHLPDHNVIHTGDTVINNLHPYFDANGGCSSLGWLETLADIAALCDNDTVVIPGHGQAGTVETVRKQTAYIEQLRDAVKRGIDAGTPLDELKDRTFAFMEGMGLENLRENAIAFVYNEMTGG